MTIALNKNRIGHRYPSYRYEVSREKLKEYAAATAVTDEAYSADPGDVALADIVAPPTFAACFTIGGGASMFADPELGAHFNLVHGSQEFTYQRPVRGGDVLECTPVIVDIADRRNMEFLTYDIECVDAGSGDPVLTARTMLIFFDGGGD